MTHLRPCPSCLRHVRADTARCPFCEGELTIEAPVAPPSEAGLGRAARMAIGAAAVATLSLAACGGAQPGGPSGASTADAGAQTPPPPPPNDMGNVAKPYGAPPADGLPPVV